MKILFRMSLIKMADRDTIIERQNCYYQAQNCAESKDVITVMLAAGAALIGLVLYSRKIKYSR